MKHLFINLSVLFLTCLALGAWGQEDVTGALYLSGTGSDRTVDWEFYCTAGSNSGRWTTIPVPSNWEFHGFGEFTYGHDKERINESGLYRHRFNVPDEWKNRTVNIVFEGVMTDAEVKINGKSAGPVHQGGYYRFKYDVSRLLRYGKENLLEVTVRKASADPSVEAAERQSDFWVYGGIYRPVRLEALPLTHIERVAIDARCDGTFRMDVFLGKALKHAEVTAQIKTLDGKPVGSPFRQTVSREDSVRLSAAIENPALWSAEFPNRYRVDVAVSENGAIRHRVSETFGFRTAELRPRDGFYVNGAKIKFKGVDRHTHWPSSGRASSYAISLQDAMLIKEMNMNAVRMSHYPPDKHFLDVCDSLGLYVIDELTAWQYPPYNTPVGRKLVRELITRDVNHPCVVMWANGNEGGFNFDLLPEYPRYDIQSRLVIHPWLEEETTNTFHYPAYGVGAHFLFEGNRVFFPTEFMHGLYDGGHGAGLDDFWKLMQDNPLSAGGFLWDLVDQGVVRNDKNGLMDTDGNHAADGILGPYREKEGSFFTIKEIWSPVYPEGATFLPPSFDGQIKVHNRYNFTNLNQCRFKAEWVRFDYLRNTVSSVETEVSVPDVAPGYAGILKVALPTGIKQYDVLYLTASDPHGKEIHTWYRTVSQAEDMAGRLVENASGQVSLSENGTVVTLRTGQTSLSLDKSRGLIRSIEVNGRTLSLANGPRFTTGNLKLSEAKTEEKDGIYTCTFLFNPENANRKTERNMIRISLLPSGWIALDYSFDVGGLHEHIGVTFDFPEDKVKSCRWLGNGPYRVWKNRMKGVTFGLWEKEYNNTITGESWVYPEFKGFHSNLYAADLTTSEGMLKIVAASEDLFLHLFTPANPVLRNNDNTLGVFPDGDISILNAISPVGTKFQAAKLMGPQSQPNNYVSSSHVNPLTGKFYLKYIPL